MVLLFIHMLTKIKIRKYMAKSSESDTERNPIRLLVPIIQAGVKDFRMFFEL